MICSFGMMHDHLYSVCRKVKNFYSKKYGIGVARFSHKGNIIHSSTKFDDAIRYQSPHDNVYLAYFAGHTGKYVRSLFNESIYS